MTVKWFLIYCLPRGVFERSCESEAGPS